MICVQVREFYTSGGLNGASIIIKYSLSQRVLPSPPSSLHATVAESYNTVDSKFDPISTP